MLVAFLLTAYLVDPVDRTDTVLELPEGRYAEAWARAATLEVSGRKDPGLPAWPAWPEQWNSAGPWERWEQLCGAEPSDERSVSLAALALQQGRSADLWQHFASIQDPVQLLRLESAIFEGAESDEFLRLAPPLPPPGAGKRPFVGQKLTRTWTRGETRLRLEVAVEPDGTQIDLVHLGGPALEVHVEVPVPPAVRIAVAYADWARQDDAAQPLVFLLSTEDPEHTGWGRYLPAARDWPRAIPDALPASVRAGGIEIVWPEAPKRALHAAVTFGRLLEVPGRLVTRPTVGDVTPLRIHLSASTPAKETDLFGLVERWALSAE